MNDIIATYYAIVNGVVIPVHIFIKQPYEEDDEWHTNYELHFDNQLVSHMDTRRSNNFGALLSIIGLLRGALERELQHRNTALYQNEEEAIEGQLGYPLDYLFHDRALNDLEQNPLQYTRDLSEL